MIRKLALFGAISALALAVAGCSDDDGPAGPTTALSGTAAVGAPIASAAITVVCADDTSGTDATPISITSGTDGKFTVTTTQMTDNHAAAPCALRIVYGSGFLYSVAQALGTVNITPLTDMAVAKAFNSAGFTPADAFNPASSFTSANIPTVVAAITTAANTLKTQIEAAEPGSTMLPDIFTTAFNADGASAYDVWLDTLATAWGGAYSATIMNNWVAGSYTWPTIEYPTVIVGTGSWDLYVSGTYNMPVYGAVTVPEYKAASAIPFSDVGMNFATYYAGATGISSTQTVNTDTEKRYTVTMNYAGFNYNLVYRYVKIAT